MSSHPSDTAIVDTVDEWEKKEQAIREKEIRLADERSRQRWEDVKKAAMYVAIVLFLPISVIILWWHFVFGDDYRDEGTKVLSTIGMFAFYGSLACGIHNAFSVPVEDQFAACNAAWEHDRCLELLHACPSKRGAVRDQCLERCPCVKPKEDGKCSLGGEDASCVMRCAHNDNFDREDSILAQCASKMDSGICQDVFDHCGNL